MTQYFWQYSVYIKYILFFFIWVVLILSLSPLIYFTVISNWSICFCKLSLLMFCDVSLAISPNHEYSIVCRQTSECFPSLLVGVEGLHAEKKGLSYLVFYIPIVPIFPISKLDLLSLDDIHAAGIPLSFLSISDSQVPRETPDKGMEKINTTTKKAIALHCKKGLSYLVLLSCF